MSNPGHLTGNAGQSGALRRRMVAVATPGRVVAGLEDDYHHVELTLLHDGERVIKVAGNFPRAPFESCPGALAKLPDLAGLALSPRMGVLPPEFAAKQHCTHMLDLALFARAQAARGGTRTYDFTVPDAEPGQADRHAIVMRDGVEQLRWTMREKTIVAPDRFAGLTMAELARWAHEGLSDEDLELVLLLRRASMIGGGRRAGAPGAFKVGDLMPRMQGACFTYQPGNEAYHRNMDSVRSFDRDPSRLLEDFAKRLPQQSSWRE